MTPKKADKRSSSRSPNAILVTAVPGSRAQIVTDVNPKDVLLGRGAPTINHEGNKRFREDVRKRKAEYNGTARHKVKGVIARQVIDEIANRNGRFLRKIETTAEAEAPGLLNGKKAWIIANDDVVVEKVKQALRDKDPERPESPGTIALAAIDVRLNPSVFGSTSTQFPCVPNLTSINDTPMLHSMEHSTLIAYRDNPMINFPQTTRHQRQIPGSHHQRFVDPNVALTMDSTIGRNALIAARQSMSPPENFQHRQMQGGIDNAGALPDPFLSLQYRNFALSDLHNQKDAVTLAILRERQQMEHNRATMMRVRNAFGGAPSRRHEIGQSSEPFTDIPSNQMLNAYAIHGILFPVSIMGGSTTPNALAGLNPSIRTNLPVALSIDPTSLGNLESLQSRHQGLILHSSTLSIPGIAPQPDEATVLGGHSSQGYDTSLPALLMQKSASTNKLASPLFMKPAFVAQQPFAELPAQTSADDSTVLHQTQVPPSNDESDRKPKASR